MKRSNLTDAGDGGGESGRGGERETGREGDKEALGQNPAASHRRPEILSACLSSPASPGSQVSSSPCLLVSPSPPLPISPSPRFPLSRSTLGTLVPIGACLILLAASLFSGCIGNPANPAATRPTTQVSIELAKPQYWYNRPSEVAVESKDFGALWKSAMRALRTSGFKPDRVTPRDGVMTSEPLVSKQLFELWRRDVATPTELAKSTLATMHRIVRFEVTRRDDGMFELIPKVLVERYSVIEHRVTSAIESREVFALTREELGRRDELVRNPLLLTEEGGVLPPEYWYPVARDPDVERGLAEYIVDRMGDKARIIKPTRVTTRPTTYPSFPLPESILRE